jgi:hypothetical protein
MEYTPLLAGGIKDRWNLQLASLRFDACAVQDAL